MAHTPEHTLEESRRLEQLASQQTGIAPVLGGAIMGTPLDTITRESLTSVSSPEFKQPTPTLTPSISGLDSTPPAPTPTPTPAPATAPLPKLEPTAIEKQASEEIKAIRAGREELAGQEAFRAEREIAAGLPELQKTQQDLSARLKALQNEALAIPLRIEQEMSGRATVGSIQGLSREAVRQNAIQALGVSSLLEASRGNITLAQDLVDRAVRAKYGPLEVAQQAKIDNLELLLKDPTLTIEQENRAHARKEIEQARNNEIKEQKKRAEDILKLAADAAATGKATSVQLEEIRKLSQKDEITEEDIVRANEIVAPFLKKEDVGKSEFERAFFREHGRLPTATELAGAGADSKVEDFARSLNAGMIKIANVPQRLRGQVLGKAKDFALEDLQEDIQTGITQNAFKDVNDAVSQLREVYPEFSKTELEQEVSSLFKPTEVETEKGLIRRGAEAVSGFFSRLFGK